MKKYLIILVVILFNQTVFAQLGGLPGAFTRLGFSARGISMGNAMTSVTTGDVTGHYNPALSSFQNEHLINLSYTFLSFDRSLNFVSYTKNFKLPNQSSGGAGITFSWINSGVSNIDGRDHDGFHTDDYSVSENQFMFAPAIQISDKFAIGIGFKFYYSRLFEGVKSTSLGFDGGVLYKVNNKLNIGLTVKDIKSQYEWSTTELYGQYGNNTKDKFPVLYTFGASYKLPKNFGLVALDFQAGNSTRTVNDIDYKSSSYIVRIGTEINAISNLKLRAGIDRFDFKEDDKFGNSRPSFGLGYQKNTKNFIIGIDYAFVMEPYSHRPLQTLTAVFKIK